MIDVSEKYVRKIKLCILFLIFTKELYFISGLAINAYALEGSAKGSNDAANPLNYVFIAILCAITTILTDFFFGTWSTMIVNVSSYLITAIGIVFVSLLAATIKKNLASKFFSYITITFAFSYLFTPIIMAVTLSCSQNTRLGCLMIQIAHHSASFLLVALEIASLIKPLIIMIPILISLLVLIWIVYTFIKTKQYFPRRTETRQQVASTILSIPWLQMFQDPNTYSDEEREKGTKLWLVAVILSYKVFGECVEDILKNVWTWQTSLMTGSELRVITKSGNLYGILGIPIFVLVHIFYQFVRVSDLKKVIYSLLLLIVSTVCTIFIESQVRPAIKNYHSLGEAHLRVINALLTPFSFVPDAQGHKKFYIKPGDERNLQYVVASSITEDILTVSVINKPAHNHHLKYIRKHIFVREGKSTTYVMCQIGMIRVTGYDPDFKGPPGTNRPGFARIQILSSHKGDIWINKHHFLLPGLGTSIVISLKPGNLSCLAIVNNTKDVFSFLVASNGAYTLLVAFDEETKTFMNMRFPMLEPTKVQYEQILIPVVIMVIAHAGTELATFYFIYSETPPSLRCSMFGIYYFYINIGRAIAKYVYTPGLTPLYLTLFFAIINAMFSIHFSLMWDKANENFDKK